MTQRDTFAILCKFMSHFRKFGGHCSENSHIRRAHKSHPPPPALRKALNYPTTYFVDFLYSGNNSFFRAKLICICGSSTCDNFTNCQFGLAPRVGPLWPCGARMWGEPQQKKNAVKVDCLGPGVLTNGLPKTRSS